VSATHFLVLRLLKAPSTPSTTTGKTARVELPALNTLRTILRSLAVSTKPRRTFLISRRNPRRFAGMPSTGDMAALFGWKIRRESHAHELRTSGPANSLRSHRIHLYLVVAPSTVERLERCFWLPVVSNGASTGRRTLFRRLSRAKYSSYISTPSRCPLGLGPKPISLPDGPSGRANNGPCEACAVANEAFVGPLASHPRVPIRGCHASRLAGSGVGMNHVVCVGVPYDGDSCSKVQE
jgi:hypothetical protein